MTDKHLRLLGSPPSVSVGINKADYRQLGRDLAVLERVGVELVHVDVMDGVFCPGMTVGPPFVAAVDGAFLTDVHLMIDEPVEKVHDHVAAGADLVTFHVEATRHPHRILQGLASADVVRGVALCPGTPIGVLEPLLDELEHVLLLMVNPGWPASAPVASYAQRIAAARTLIGDRRIILSVDGAVTKDNIGEIAAAGPDVIVTGTAVFAEGDPETNAQLMLGRARAASAGTPA